MARGHPWSCTTWVGGMVPVKWGHGEFYLRRGGFVIKCIFLKAAFEVGEKETFIIIFQLVKNFKKDWKKKKKNIFIIISFPVAGKCLALLPEYVSCIFSWREHLYCHLNLSPLSFSSAIWVNSIYLSKQYLCSLLN